MNLGAGSSSLLSTNFLLPCAFAAVVFHCASCKSSHRQNRTPGACLNSCTSFLCCFSSCQKMSYNLFLLAFVLGIGGTFQYGLQVSIINSPAEVSTDSSKLSSQHGFQCPRALLSLFPVTSFSILLSKLDLWLPGSQSSCHRSCVSLLLNFCLVSRNWERGG